MTQPIVVNLSSNGDYWQGDWKDLSGRRRKRSLGPKAEFSRRQAKKLCQKLENTLNKKPGMADAAKAPGLGAFAEGYITSRTDLKSGTLYLHRLTKKYLSEFFGLETRIDQITRAGAREWQTALSKGRFSADRPMAAPTVRGHIVNAKAMFRRAVDDDLILFNPFDRVTVPLPKMDKDWHYVSFDELDKLLDACKTVGWKALIALCRLAGLRRGEALALPWSAVDWKNRRLTVYAEKTGSKRIVPIEPKLYPILSDAFEEVRVGQMQVCDVNPHCLWRNFTVIRKHAGLPAWKDAFHVMRRNCETDWANHFPQHVVSEWLGHDITVSAEHYLAVPVELYDRAAGIVSSDANRRGVAPISAQKPEDSS